MIISTPYTTIRYVRTIILVIVLLMPWSFVFSSEQKEDLDKNFYPLTERNIISLPLEALDNLVMKLQRNKKALKNLRVTCKVFDQVTERYWRDFYFNLNEKSLPVYCARPYPFVKVQADSLKTHFRIQLKSIIPSSKIRRLILSKEQGSLSAERYKYNPNYG